MEKHKNKFTVRFPDFWSIPYNDIDMKLGPAIELDKRNTATSKNFDDDVMWVNCDVIVIVPIYLILSLFHFSISIFPIPMVQLTQFFKGYINKDLPPQSIQSTHIHTMTLTSQKAQWRKATSGCRILEKLHMFEKKKIQVTVLHQTVYNFYLTYFNLLLFDILQLTFCYFLVKCISAGFIPVCVRFLLVQYLTLFLHKIQDNLKFLVD